MNIENNFNNAEAYLKMAKEKFSAEDFDSALASLGKLYALTRKLMNQVYSLKALKAEVTEQE